MQDLFATLFSAFPREFHKSPYFEKTQGSYISLLFWYLMQSYICWKGSNYFCYMCKVWWEHFISPSHLINLPRELRIFWDHSNCFSFSFFNLIFLLNILVHTWSLAPLPERKELLFYRVHSTRTVEYGLRKYYFHIPKPRVVIKNILTPRVIKFKKFFLVSIYMIWNSQVTQEFRNIRFYIYK